MNSLKADLACGWNVDYVTVMNWNPFWKFKPPPIGEG